MAIRIFVPDCHDLFEPCAIIEQQQQRRRPRSEESGCEERGNSPVEERTPRECNRQIAIFVQFIYPPRGTAMPFGPQSASEVARRGASKERWDGSQHASSAREWLGRKCDDEATLIPIHTALVANTTGSSRAGIGQDSALRRAEHRDVPPHPPIALCADAERRSGHKPKRLGAIWAMIGRASLVHSD
ncbi:uncharacterized protein BDR25DRAFT_384657 [Lindgomyces ingoldianus]|uniref:Uncharacterized protein n=1 Tax=Lindgomyces ingoldianus TaxID=673940 RepID=A0ACB6QB32_9PLEO|nr:uncharacterized protein BDR25DRAFT_384657 [Lindgomyces ingoldianus]KAF2463356.1 hypothetical protein BDR25DRAFT_384657 [Lindgomyces ingoldianus]